MNKEEFNLSERRHHGGEKFAYIHVEDVKEFIKRLKEGIDPLPNTSPYNVGKIIDKLAGEKLI